MHRDSAHTNAAERLELGDSVLFPGSTIRDAVDLRTKSLRDLIAEHVGNPRADERALQLLDELEECLL